MIHSQPTDLRTTFDEVLAILRRTIDPRIALEAAKPARLWLVDVDPSQMTQVLMNLCINARDAMPDGGRLRLEAENIVLDEEYARLHLEARAGEFVRLRVSDTGTGIPPEVRARIFEPFFTTKEPGKGTGLGLAMVFGIVKQHQGWIDCYSEVGQGTRFDVYLPRGRSGATVPVPGATQPPRRGHETVLLADDEVMIRKLGQAILRHYGYEVLLAEDGEQAVELYARRRADIALVILDLTMPRLSGRDAFRRLRELDPAVRVLFASGYSTEHLAEEDLRRACGFVGKPYRPEDLARTVRAVLDQAP
jgi:CheY-like chemotaxis protein